eukprot:1158836-Pelagomonas_calceolata.AAC.3
MSALEAKMMGEKWGGHVVWHKHYHCPLIRTVPVYVICPSPMLMLMPVHVHVPYAHTYAFVKPSGGSHEEDSQVCPIVEAMPLSSLAVGARGGLSSLPYC